MKSILILVEFFLSYSAWSEVTYPIQNFKYISDWDYRQEVQDSDKYVVMVFSSNSCLERTIIERNCFLFEKKLDHFVPGFGPKLKVVGFNTYFENYHVVSQFNIIKVPTVIILKENHVIRRMEASYSTPDVMNGRFAWQDELLKEVLDTVSKIR